MLAHLVSLSLCSVAMAGMNYVEVFMRRTNSAKGLIVLAHTTQSHWLCTLTQVIASNPLPFENRFMTAQNSSKNRQAQRGETVNCSVRLICIINNVQLLYLGD